jgi:hypothetical protein
VVLTHDVTTMSRHAYDRVRASKPMPGVFEVARHVPIMLFVHRRLKLRPADGPPGAAELVIPLVLWAWMFEWLLPRTGAWSRWCTSDPGDILCYAVGALGGGLFWQWWYRRREPEAKPHTGRRQAR